MERCYASALPAPLRRRQCLYHHPSKIVTFPHVFLRCQRCHSNASDEHYSTKRKINQKQPSIKYLLFDTSLSLFLSPNWSEFARLLECETQLPYGSNQNQTGRSRASFHVVTFSVAFPDGPFVFCSLAPLTSPKTYFYQNHFRWMLENCVQITAPSRTKPLGRIVGTLEKTA